MLKLHAPEKSLSQQGRSKRASQLCCIPSCVSVLNSEDEWCAQDVMKLDKEQKRRLVGLRNELFERMESIIEQRRRIITHLEVRSYHPFWAPCSFCGISYCSRTGADEEPLQG